MFGISLPNETPVFVPLLLPCESFASPSSLYHETKPDVEGLAVGVPLLYNAVTSVDVRASL